MCNCRPEQRDRARRAARELRADERVAGVAVIEPAASSTGRWELEVTTVDHDGVPSLILEAVCEHARSVRTVGPQGPDVRQVVATV